MQPRGKRGDGFAGVVGDVIQRPEVSCSSDARVRNTRELSETNRGPHSLRGGVSPARHSRALKRCGSFARATSSPDRARAFSRARSFGSFSTSSGQSSRPFAAAYHAEKATASRHRLSESCGCAARRKSQEAACGMEICSLDDMKRASVFVWSTGVSRGALSDVVLGASDDCDGSILFSWAHTASKSSIDTWDCITVGGGPCRTASAGIANSSVLATSSAIDNCSGVGLPGSFTKLTTECDPQCAQAFDQHSSYYSEK